MPRAKVVAPSLGPLCDAYGFGPTGVQEAVAASLVIALLCEVLNVYVMPWLIVKSWPKGAPLTNLTGARPADHTSAPNGSRSPEVSAANVEWCAPPSSPSWSTWSTAHSSRRSTPRLRGHPRRRRAQRVRSWRACCVQAVRGRACAGGRRSNRRARRRSYRGCAAPPRRARPKPEEQDHNNTQCARGGPGCAIAHGQVPP